MRLLTGGFCTSVAVALLVGCSANGSSPSSTTSGGAGITSQAGHHHMVMTTIPKQFIKVGKYHKIRVPASFTRGIATAEFFATSSNVLIYPKRNAANGPATCTISTGSNVNNIGADSSGNLVVPNAFSGVLVYAPPFTASSCGTLLGTITDAYGQASDAAAINAATGTIVVGHIGGGTSTGVVICTLSSLTCTALTSPNMSTLAGVAMDKGGNCYADAFDITSGLVGLWYYAGCTGVGTELTSANGFSEPYYGGIDIDNDDNLVVISLFNSSFTTPSTVTVYSGCGTGTCTVVAGPTALAGESVFGHVARQNQRFVTADITSSAIEVYSYSIETGVGSMLYSFNNGLSCVTNLCEAAAYMPNGQR
jgi:hypothetical protein